MGRSLRRSALTGLALCMCVAREGYACDPVWLPITRDPREAYFVAAAAEAREVGVRARLLISGGAAPGLKTGSAILVPWAYGPDCQPVPWGSAPAWDPPREPAFYTGQVRPREKWLEGLPTVDVYMAWREPLWRSKDPRWPHPISDAGLLDPAEFLQLYAALPNATTLARSPAAVLRDLDRWASRLQAIVSREPAVTIQTNLRRAAATKRNP